MKRNIVMLAIALGAQWPISWATRLARVASETNWSEVLGDKSLPALTDATLTCLPFLPAAAIVAVVATFSTGLVRRNPSIALWGIFLTVAAEACLLAVAALGVVLPALSITYRMSS